MTKKKKFLILAFLLIFAGLIFFLIYDIGAPKSKHPTPISVIVRGTNSEQWAHVKQGMDQAALDFNAEISFVTLQVSNDAQQQISMLQRELDGGTKGIILSAADSIALSPIVDKIVAKIPVVAFESPVQFSNLTGLLTMDNYAMGVAIIDEVVAQGNVDKNVIILNNSPNCHNISERIKGITYQLLKTNNTSEMVTISNLPKEANVQIYDLLRSYKANVIVCPDPLVLEMVASIMQENYEENTQLFGIGATSVITSYLEKDIIKASIVPNDFSTGYLAVEDVIKTLQNKNIKKTMEVSFQMVNKNNMYDSGREKLLFPFVR